MFNKLKSVAASAVSTVSDAATASERKIAEFAEAAPDTIHKYADRFSESDLWNKMKTAATTAGQKLMLMVLALFYSLETAAAKDKIMIAGALGYFILPVDLVPDIMPGGYADDLGALSAVYKVVRENITDDTMNRAQNKVDEIFGKNTPVVADTGI